MSNETTPTKLSPRLANQASASRASLTVTLYYLIDRIQEIHNIGLENSTLTGADKAFLVGAIVYVMTLIAKIIQHSEAFKKAPPEIQASLENLIEESESARDEVENPAQPKADTAN